jgi:mono/diheme cytochrome c family protein
MSKSRVAFPATLAAALTLLAPGGAAGDTDSGAAGRELYEAYQCWQCHGYEGQGGAAPRVAPGAYPFEAFERFVRYPNQMPAYPRELLGDNELRTIWEFLKSQPEPPPVDDIPALKEL